MTVEIFGKILPALIVTIISGIVGKVVYDRYVGILGCGACALGSPEREAYDHLRASLADGGKPVQIYSRLLGRFLDAVDRFFGDVGTANAPGILRLFMLRTPAPLWTFASFKRCLLLALLYPVLAIFLIWVATGHVGPAETALHLPADIPDWRRYIECARIFVGSIGIIIFEMRQGPMSSIMFIVSAAILLYSPVVGMVALAVSILAVEYMRNRPVIVLALIFPVAVSYFLGVLHPPHSTWWGATNSLLLFLGVLPLLNALFDWLSLGVSRGLMRRGSELCGWGPFWLSIIDGVLSTVSIVMLVIFMVIGVQAFNMVAVRAGENEVLLLNDLFSGIVKTPGAPEYWWIYALLLTTQLPSLFNIFIGSTALFRSISFLSRWTLQFIPEGESVLSFNRGVISAWLITLWCASLAFGIAAQGLLLWGILFHLLPMFDTGILEVAVTVARFDVPGRVLALAGW